MNRTIEDVRFDTLRNALYHTARRMSFDRYNRWASFFVILLGTASIGDAFAFYSIDIQRGWFGAAVAAVGAAQLVFDFGGRARDHQTLQREYYNLLSEIESCTDMSDEQIAAWYGKIAKIMGDEPPTFRAVDAKAYNDALDATGGHDRSKRLFIPLSQKVFGGVFTFDGARYDTFGEIEKP